MQQEALRSVADKHRKSDEELDEALLHLRNIAVRQPDAVLKFFETLHGRMHECWLVDLLDQVRTIKRLKSGVLRELDE